MVARTLDNSHGEGPAAVPNAESGGHPGEGVRGARLAQEHGVLGKDIWAHRHRNLSRSAVPRVPDMLPEGKHVQV